MKDEHKNFSVWLFRPRGWEEGDAGRLVSGGFIEPAEAADLAERTLKSKGVIGQSYCELRFNGEAMPHTVVCYTADNEFGIWNTEVSRWPIFYAEHGELMLSEFPFVEADDGNSWQQKDEADKSEKSDEGNMKLDEIESADTEEEDAQDEEEFDWDESEEDSGEDAEDDSDDDSDGSSWDDDSEESEDENEGEDSDEEAEANSSVEREVEMPRLKIFAKLRGPLGWRKRAEAEELQEKNTFGMKLGIVDEEALENGHSNAAIEREVFAHVEFIEHDEKRTSGTLRVKLPTVSPDDLEDGIILRRKGKSGWFEIEIPYRENDDE